MNTPFPAASPSAFTTTGAPTSSTKRAASSGSIERAEDGGRDAERAQQLLRERLPALEPRRRRGRPEGAQPRLARTGRRCPSVSGSSGPTTVRSIALLAREAREARHDRRPRPRTHSRRRAMPALPGRAPHALDPRAPAELPGQRVLAAAAADDEDPHATQCRKWRTPVNTIAMPCASAARDHLVVAHAAARLHDRRGAGRDAPPRGRRGTGRTRRSRAPSRRARCRARRARARALRTGSTREVWPPPSASVRSARGEDDRVRLDVLHDAPGEVERAQLVGGRRALRHDAAPGADPRSRGRRPAPAGRRRRRAAPAALGRHRRRRCQRTSRRFFFLRSSSSASGSNSGAISTSVKISSTTCASASVHGG